ncbi:MULTISPECIES: maltose alpha-D-glucosyltransferase [Rhodopseudomonas]|uniref:maltose alpha-D-glucosyltransferase n=1 Tax=Rhodopseudomonas palustris TaxID=1076 RepID=A0A0D7F0T8_RHOPL|nr:MULTISPECIES: maltose alpha-D-glucosyltransferase [Rhodopseudomonas]KIZ46476.1 alpha-amylase [Rhodopseudomonas palustris]MDF3809675.1 maltose alpha-D-glucosyltransferase [Rhodopseudomonas sp. BAL398]WOK18217.1 maltose alpha-D-glucosyltransferase [Rhodopseudomonas sp. BAL398]
MNIMPSIEPTETQDGTATDALWYKDAIIYQLHVKAFADSNNDGIGDFAGLTGKLDYLQELGVTAIWLMPFYPSPGRDDGYDIADYGAIHPDFGTMKDFRRFISEAKRRGLRVITELVINHTSDQHDWFKRARRSPPGSSARDWYVWSDSDEKYDGTRIIFTDTEKSNWTWDPVANAYYWHRFFSHQPDLNFDNPRVVSAVVQVMKRWLDAGVDGFRLDAIPYLVERDGTNNENLPETHAIIKHLRAELDAYAPGKLLLAEANQWPEDVQQYFGDSDECHMAYHFPLMPRIYMAIAQEDRFPITDILRQTPDIPADCQWAMFLRNHDELTLEMVTDVERDYLWSTYANDPRARINVGIRRRLAPLMENDRRKIELMNSLLLSFPGTPIIYYGDEIGMGDNIYLGDRNGVRTPMQWTPDRNGGFSRADPARLYAPTIMDPVYGYESVNVEAQSRSLSSLLSVTKRLMAVRKSTLAFGRGTMTFIRPQNRSVLVYVRQFDGEVILCVANLSRSAQPTELDLSAFNGRVPQEMLGRTKFPPIGELPYMITLAPYGFYWFRLCEPEPSKAATVRAVPEFETLVVPLGATWNTLARTRTVFERDVLPAYLSRTRWFPERSARAIHPVVTSAIPFCNDGDIRPWLAFFEVTQRGTTARYVLPMRIDWIRFDRERYNPRAFAAVRQASREGTLLDVASDPAFIELLLKNLRASLTVEEDGNRLEFRPTAPLLAREDHPFQNIRAVETEQSNSTALVDESYVVKLYRRLETGISPEIEMGRFLTEIAGFANTPALLGSIELVEGDAISAVAVVHAFVGNQGDGWTVTSAYLDRFVDEQRLLAGAEQPADSEELPPYLRYMAQTGRRVAEMHVALASHDDIADFAPEPITADEARSWVDGVAADAERVCDELMRKRDTVKEQDRALIDQLLAQRGMMRERLEALFDENGGGLNIRHHGDFHLGQMLIVKDDIFIIDFEGEPRRSLVERRRKSPAARDVAGLIRSIDYSTTAALDRALKVAPDEQGKLAAALEDWRNRSTDAFHDAYRDAMTNTSLWPAAPDAAERLLDFFLLEKAIYEIEYELAHRPDWLRVPLAGMLNILARHPEENT